MQLSPHFKLEEFQTHEPIPVDCNGIFGLLANEVLELIRAELNRPMRITSGYRSAAYNKAIHGAPRSQHIARPDTYAAADWEIDPINPTIYTYQMIFDWIRSNPTLNFNQVIIERGTSGLTIIHTSIDVAAVGVRSAWSGATFNQSPYTRFDCVPFAPKSQEIVA